MSFNSRILLELAAAILGAVIVTATVDVAHISPYWLLLLLPPIGLVVGYRMARLRLRVFRSGVVAYSDCFAFSSGPGYWVETAEELLYWGITGASIVEPLRSFLHDESGDSRRYRFLLMSTSGNAIREQIAFKKGFPIFGRSPAEDQSIDAEITVENQRLQATIAVLKATRAYRASPSRLEIRLYDEFLPWWMYVLDRKRLVVGILRSRQEVGEQAAAIVAKNDNQVTLFESFYENAERVWRAARPV
jgi:hypothetical protein